MRKNSVRSPGRGLVHGRGTKPATEGRTGGAGGRSADISLLPEIRYFFLKTYFRQFPYRKKTAYLSRIVDSEKKLLRTFSIVSITFFASFCNDVEQPIQLFVKRSPGALAEGPSLNVWRRGLIFNKAEGARPNSKSYETTRA
jgi:hypothetical protein